MNKAAVGIAIGSVALLGLTGVAASMSQTSATVPSPSASANVRVTTAPTPVATRVATPNYVEPTAIPTTPAPLARTDESAPVVPAPVAPVVSAPVIVPKSASAAVVAAPVPTVVPITKVVIPTPPPLGTGSGVDCAHLKPGDAFAGISQVCHLDPKDPLYVCKDTRPGMCNMAGGPGLVIPPKPVATPPVCGVGSDKK